MKKITHKIILLGPQACGKGTQGKLLSEIFGIERISTGEIFREEIAKKTDLGLKIQNLIAEGQLISDELTFKLLKKRLANTECRNGFILDGYPRSINQVKYLDDITNIDFVFEIDISNREAVRRIENRRICDKCGASYDLKLFPSKKGDKCEKCDGNVVRRADDYPEAIRKRLATYREQVRPIVRFYKKRRLLIKINGLNTVEKISEKIKEEILKRVNVEII